MAKVLSIGKRAEDGLKELLRFLLENGKVKGVITLRKTGADGAISYSLITHPEDIESTAPLLPLMPVNLAKQLSRLTLIEPATEPIAVALRPCELRAFVELAKRTQGSLENFLFISSTCGGVYPLEMAVQGNIERQLPQYWQAVEQSEPIANIRAACKACEYFMPYTADITVSLLGNKDLEKETTLLLNTEKGEVAVEGISGKFSEEELDAAAIEKTRTKREAEKKKLSDEVELRNLGIDEVTKTFSRCIGCRNCSKVCPACYCHVCFFETETSEHEAAYYETALEKNGCVNMLSDTVFYHLVRLFHVSTSCTACGQCADVCPANIPLWAVSLKVSEAVQKAFDYLPGKDVKEGLPLTTFVPEEFAGIA
ncbi:MAG: 4Fe-4S dicluster domain-containing protein [Dehalococcoidia bacterium]